MSEYALENACAQYIEKHQLFTKNDSLLLGVSGGKDSMVLASILHKMGYAIIVAHCNFRLRGQASDSDEQLVQQWCKQYDVPFHIKHFDTVAFAEKENISIEMAARELRYNWFEDIRKNLKAQAIAVAHHLNDHVETFMLNITRGTGISGLKGIVPKNGNVVRPLLFASRQMIDAYAYDLQIPFRTDHTNEDVRFKRNFIRHEIIPHFQQLNPSFLNTMQQNMVRFEHVARFMETQFETMEQRLVTQNGTDLFIHFPEEVEMLVFTDFLHYFFKKNEFNAPLAEVAALAQLQVGKRVLFGNQQIVKERSGLVISKASEDTPHSVQVVTFPGKVQFNPYEFTFTTFDVSDELAMPQGANVVWLDAHKIELPVSIRVWQPGDTMIPFGMQGNRKIKKMLTDAKISNVARKNYPVVCDKSAIIWLPGIRPHNHFAVSAHTRRVLCIAIRLLPAQF
ncbi:MAG: tRNA lysidine(34) synthetase TilS [Salinivirgaceae bacterium]|jgi:tRNA(Ile)-lysidine synthase|nr:tRNA lysidine(34) synthetase TilS [Salinivirgaceae bacterium]